VIGRFDAYVDERFVDTEAYAEPSEVHVLNAERTSYETYAYDGIFFQEEVREDHRVWILVEPEPGSGHLPTLGRHDTTKATVTFTLFPRSAVDFIFGSLSSALARNEEAAQVFVQIEDALGKPVEGASLVSAQTDQMIYFDSGIWTEFSTVTDSSGRVFLYNVLARDLPGETLLVALTGTAKGQFEIPIVSGAVTSATLRTD
jgi:hypothetical protein